MALDGKIESPFLYVVGCLFLIGMVANVFSCDINTVKYSDGAPVSAIGTSQQYEIIDHKFCYGEWGIRSICGTLKNKTGRKLDYVQISFSLFDAAGNQIGSTFDNLSHLAPNSTWKFNAVVLDDNNVDSYKLEEVSGF